MPAPALPPTPEGMDEFAWAAAIGEIRGYCGWHIAPSLTETVTVDGSGSNVLLLPTLHLTGVTSVTNDGTAVDSDDLRWSQIGALAGPRWTWKWRGIVAEIEHGYEEFPPEVLAVARSMAAAGPNGSIGKRLTSGPHSVELSDEAMAGPATKQALHRAVLDRYRVKASS